MWCPPVEAQSGGAQPRRGTYHRRVGSALPVYLLLDSDETVAGSWSAFLSTSVLIPRTSGLIISDEKIAV